MHIYPEYISEAECVDLDIAGNVYADFSLVFTTPGAKSNFEKRSSPTRLWRPPNHRVFLLLTSEVLPNAGGKADMDTLSEPLMCFSRRPGPDEILEAFQKEPGGPRRPIKISRLFQ
ncbi:hypothetical protein EYF80_028521 [Liparis tanakae]|uniref:Uncharacterized protein n=1 Tax=Liparis tanakae TaxID=230148 RepID=A0A4Z2H659_9TELE|nr:hypothetical protein EYF80_028521 [Liparis tanakae]